MAVLVPRELGILAGVLVVAYAGALGYLRLNEREFIFHPEERRVEVPASRFALHEKRVTYASTDGVRLSAWIVPAAGTSSDRWLLICHGNLGNIGYGQRPEFYADA